MHGSHVHLRARHSPKEVELQPRATATYAYVHVTRLLRARHSSEADSGPAAKSGSHVRLRARHPPEEVDLQPRATAMYAYVHVTRLLCILEEIRARAAGVTPT
jgi:hypothetical protein